jgi:hypothetical protein
VIKNATIEYKIGNRDHGRPIGNRMQFNNRRAWIPTRLLVATLALGLAQSAIADETQHGEAAMTCTNPVSGASWQIKIDYDKRTVDSNPARISDATISWHDATGGGNYTLDRKSGNLTVVIASSTGGSFLYDRCAISRQ